MLNSHPRNFSCSPPVPPSVAEVFYARDPDLPQQRSTACQPTEAAPAAVRKPLCIKWCTVATDSESSWRFGCEPTCYVVKIYSSSTCRASPLQCGYKSFMLHPCVNGITCKLYPLWKWDAHPSIVTKTMGGWYFFGWTPRLEINVASEIRLWHSADIVRDKSTVSGTAHSVFSWVCWKIQGSSQKQRSESSK